ncbi:hypothetical protein PS639_02292 [Pseudomonas fluorescens]|nr:hypothetical protein PS639_02292 [Pseudomonas fluorescens]
MHEIGRWGLAEPIWLRMAQILVGAGLLAKAVCQLKYR